MAETSEWDSVTNTFRSHPVSVIVPAKNEAANLPHVLPRIPRWVHEVILVDGHSKDDTVEVALRSWPGIRIVEQQGRGKGAALRTGFAAATAEIPGFIGQLFAGADFVKGSRFH